MLGGPLRVVFGLLGFPIFFTQMRDIQHLEFDIDRVPMLHSLDYWVLIDVWIILKLDCYILT